MNLLIASSLTQMRRPMLAACITLLSCAPDEQPAHTAGRARSVPAGIVVDSSFPVEEQIRRFKAARSGAAATELTGGSASRDALVARFVTAVANHDTADIRSMALNAAEYIDLYYPSSMFAKPPYQQSPELRWFLMQELSNRGISRLLQRYGGQPIALRAYRCAAQPIVEGENKQWDRCVVSWNLQPSNLRIFSTIIERDGRFKIMSFANGL
jgi:hypothetical protein